MELVGEAYIFDTDVFGTMINAIPRATLISGDALAAAGDQFGTAISGAGTLVAPGPDFVAVGVPLGDNASGLNVGRVEIFDAGGGYVTSIANPNPAPGAPAEFFGQSLAKVDLAGTIDDGFLVGNHTFFDGTNAPGRVFMYRNPNPTNMIPIPFADVQPPPLSTDVYPPSFGLVVAHTPNFATESSLLGRTMISAPTRDVQDDFGYRSASPRIHVNLGRVYLFRYVFPPP